MGTATHVIEPVYPGAHESIVDITACWNDDVLYANREEIIRLSKACSRCHEYCCRFLSAAGSIAADTYRIALDCVNHSKLNGYISRLSDREFKNLKKGPGKESVRFLTAVTNKGVMHFTDTAKHLCKKIYLVNDEQGAVSRLMLNGVRSAALAAGYDIISCYCPLAPFEKLEQLFVPQLELGFLTSNRYHNFSDEVDPYRIVNSQRFMDADKLKEAKRRLAFNRKVMSQMVMQAESLLAEAKSTHDELEGYYIGATDFAAVGALAEAVLKKVEGMR